MRAKRFCFVATLSLIVSLVWPAMPTSAFEMGEHESLTAEALSFLNSAMLGDINDEHSYQDILNFDASSHHFDNCRFAESADYVNQQYTRPNDAFNGDGGVLAELNPVDPQSFDAADEFGQLLHTAEDFYAHSNWVEMGRTDLLDSELGLWAPLNPWTVLRDNVIVAQGESLPSGWAASQGPNPKVPIIAAGAGQGIALISGTFLLSDDCYDAIALPHGSDGTDALNKDKPSRPGFAEARVLAIRQAQHEWCRMLNLLKNEYGFAGASIPMALWVDPGKYPHPQGTLCAQSGPAGEINVTVKLDNLQILDDTDSTGNGEINLVLVVYTGDFRNSVRVHIGPVDIASGESLSGDMLSSMQLTLPCLANNDTAVATLQGWDDEAGTSGIYDDAVLDPDEVLSGVNVTVAAGELGARQIATSSSHLDAKFSIEASVSSDADADGLSDCREQLLKTDPANADTDQDGVSDGLEVNVYGTNPLQADPYADLGVTQNINPNPLIAGGDFLYTLSVSNAGPASAADVTVADQIPPTISVGAITPAENCTQQQSVITCVFDSLAAGETKNIEVSARAHPELVDGAILTSTATVTATVIDIVPGNNTAVLAAPSVRRADLVLQQTDSPDPVAAGGVLIYTFVIANQGPSVASNATLSTTLPPGFVYRMNESYGGCTEKQGNVLCALGAVLPSVQLTVPVLVAVDPLIAVRTVVPSGGSVRASEVDTAPQNNDTSIETVVTRSTGLAVTHVSRTDPVFANRQIIYTVRVSNMGDSIATGVVLTSTLPEGVTFDAQGSNLGCIAIGQDVTCDLGTLPDGSSKTALLAGQVASTVAAGTGLTNRVRVFSNEIDPDQSDNVDEDLAIVGSQLFFSQVLNQPPLNLPGDVDLIVKTISVDIDGPEVTIQNVGKGAIIPGNNFWVDLYFGSPITPTAVNQTWQVLQAKGGVVWGVMGAGTRLGPGDELTLRLGDAYYSPSESRIPKVIDAGVVYAHVDAANIATDYGGVLETHEVRHEAYTNNIAWIELSAAIRTDRWKNASAGTVQDAAVVEQDLPPR